MSFNIKTCAVVLVSGILASCSGMVSQSEVDALNKAEAIGSPFTQQLAKEYKTVANYEQDKMYDYPDALHFARKGILSARGEVVLPEPLDNWNINSELVGELQQARARLIASLDKGAREAAPMDTAIAQARFDCWIEQQEEGWQKDEINQCKEDFFASIGKIESLIGRVDDKGNISKEDTVSDNSRPEVPTDKSPSAAELADLTGLPKLDKDDIIPIEDAMFLAFFDFNSSVVEAGAEDVVAAVAEQILRRKDVTKVVVKGHADTAGSDKYNKHLSERRAKAIKTGLIKHGIAADLIVTEGMGESQLLVETPNNTREPANRRSEIRFE